MTTTFNGKSSKIFNCKICDYNTSRQSQFNRHLMTGKHVRNNEITTGNVQKVPPAYVCFCNKIYSDRAGLWRHKKKCVIANSTEFSTDSPTEFSNEIVVDTSDIKLDIKEIECSTIPVMDMNLIMGLLKDNHEFKQIMIEQNKTIVELAGKLGNNNITNTNSHNNTQFNLQFFLNETCKDAMNVTQFLDFIKVELEDLDYTGKAGYIEGVTRIFAKNLERLGKFEKPFWTTDEKRETIMTKENGVWEKDDEHKQMNKVISKIERKNLMQLSPWKEAHPGWQNSDKLGEFLAKIQKNIMGGEPSMECGYPDEIKSNEKIVRNIIKKTIIPKK